MPPKSSKAKKASKAAASQKQQPVSNDIPEKRIKSAISGLEKYLKKEDDSEKVNEKTGKFKLIDDDEDELKDKLQLIIVNNVPFNEDTDVSKTKKAAFKPLTITTASSIHNHISEFKKILVIVNDTVKFNTDKEDETSSIYKLINEDKIPIGEVITPKKLKTLYKPFENRRQLLADHSFILCDDSIVTMMPKLLGGKAFNKISSTPIPIRVRHSSTTLSTSIKNFWNKKTAAKYPNGATLNINLGNLLTYTTEDQKHELVENIKIISKQFLDKYMIRSIFLKSNFSPVIPIFYNEKSLKELIKSKEAAKSEEETNDVIKEKVEINGVEIELNAFNRALYEIANPEELETIFKKQITSAQKRKAEDVEEDKPETKTPAKKQRKSVKKA
ncbi:uncharacterized protein HGUI_02914 [Hanseniaspora guilliermondii]|uniref:Proteasome-interacting protein CIC1 n=1 Tax=Hanseniaspora guilliermondii TaxID=56406 RepID=A0A1L0B2T8_9ASCO|nr:uncharacterized protein HGUI_02914 [Hanseniaspora guilliermondii]